MLCRLTPALLLAATGFAQAADPSDACFQELASMQQLQQVRALIALSSTREQTLDMITNTRAPMPHEKPPIKAWVEARDGCFMRGVAWREQHMPADMRQLIDLYFAKSKLLAAELYSGQRSYAEFAARRADLSAELHAQLENAWRESHSEHAAHRGATTDGGWIAAGTAALQAEASRLLRDE